MGTRALASMDMAMLPLGLWTSTDGQALTYDSAEFRNFKAETELEEEAVGATLDGTVPHVSQILCC